MSKRKKEKEITPPFPAEKKKKSLTIKQAWPVIFLFLLLVFFILHLLTFKDTDAIFLIREKDEFLSLINLRCFKLGLLIVMNAAILAFVLTYIPIRIISILSSTGLWILLFFYSGEMYLSIFPPSQGNNEAYISKIWFKRYWETNKYGFRDKDYMLDELKYKKKDLIVFLGDSYIAGHGINDPKDRTADILETALKTDYYLINTGINGIGTLKEFSILKGFPLRPKVIILSHVSNDIEEILPQEESYAAAYQQTESNLSIFLFSNSRNSILGDLLYHYIKQLVFASRQQVTNTNSPETKNAFHEWYKVDTIFNQHLKNIKRISDYSIDSLHAKFILVTYPEGGGKEIDSTDIYINRKIINSLAHRNNFYTLNVTPIFRRFKPNDRIVNFLDGHPSKKINQLVADTLIQLITSPDFKKQPPAMP